MRLSSLQDSLGNSLTVKDDSIWEPVPGLGTGVPRGSQCRNPFLGLRLCPVLNCGTATNVHAQSRRAYIYGACNLAHVDILGYLGYDLDSKYLSLQCKICVRLVYIENNTVPHMRNKA